MSAPSLYTNCMWRTALQSVSCLTWQSTPGRPSLCIKIWVIFQIYNFTSQFVRLYENVHFLGDLQREGGRLGLCGGKGWRG